MKILNILNEYDSSKTLSIFGDKIATVAQRRGYDSPQDALNVIERMDPTNNKQYVVWLVRQFIAKQIRLEDSARVKEVLSRFINVKNKLPLDKRDIGRMSFHSLEELIDSVYNVELHSNSNKSDRKIPEDAEVLYNGPLGLLVSPTTKEASCELGRGTKWCTASDSNNMFSHYNNQEPLYIWIDKNGDKYQFHFTTFQFMDARDRPISKDKLSYFRNEHPVLSKFFKQQEKEMIAKNDYEYDLVVYAIHVVGGRFEAAEEKIAQDWYAAVMYAKDVLKGRFELGEPSIARNPDAAITYAVNVTKQRFPEAEKLLYKDPQFASEYAIKVLKARVPAAEKLIGTDVLAARDYVEAFGVRLRTYEENYLKRLDRPDLINEYIDNLSQKDAEDVVKMLKGQSE